MKRSQLKMIVKECVKEILFEEGVLSSLVAEVAVGITKANMTLTEQPTASKANFKESQQKLVEEQEAQRKEKIMETKKKMIEAMGDRMSNVFEGTEPLRSAGSPDSGPSTSPLSGLDPKDAGVDITGLFSVAGKKWNALK